jgi:two-component system, OmpR family, copper resistance phosphate regulon response regulator CusR
MADNFSFKLSGAEMRLLVVEDQRKLASFIKKGLTQVGYAVDVAESAGAAESLAAANRYDLIVLDIMLPDQNGIDTARHLRADGFEGRILMLTALSGTKDRVHGLDAGADDYLAKPFDFEELCARIRALLRRSGSGKGGSNSVFRVADLEMNLISRSVTRAGQKIQLTPKEFSLLEFLLRNAGRQVTRACIAESVWDMHYDSDSNVIDVYVNTLRKKVDLEGKHKLIQTVIGVGYLLTDDETE